MPSYETCSSPIKHSCLKQIDYSATTEFVWNIFNVKKDQDLRIKLGYDVVDKVRLLSVN